MKPRKTAPAKRNLIARDLRTPKYRLRSVRPKRGAGSYDRNSRRQDRLGGDYFMRTRRGRR